MAAQGINEFCIDIRRVRQIDLNTVVRCVSQFFDKIRVYYRLDKISPVTVKEHSGISYEGHLYLEDSVEFLANPIQVNPGLDHGQAVLTLFLSPGNHLDVDLLFNWLLKQKVPIFKLAFNIPANAQKTTYQDSFKSLSDRVTVLIERLSANGIRTEIFGPLPFCFFSDANLGVLARESLPYADYRKDTITLSIDAKGNITPWNGFDWLPVTYLDDGMTLKDLHDFYRVRRQEFAYKLDLFRECGSCKYKLTGKCSAAHYYGKHRRGINNLGFYPAKLLPAMAPFLSCRVHNNVSFIKGEDYKILTIKGDRTLPSQKLNSSAFAFYELCKAYGNLARVLEKVRELFGLSYMENFLHLLDQFQKNGFLVLEPLKKFSADIEAELKNSIAQTWRYL